MSEIAYSTALPTSLPVLSRGKHRNPSRGACFMEYTSVLAGEPFTDEPQCVDEGLAGVLRGANDRLSDTYRARLVALLGRAIGLTVGPPPPRGGWRQSRAARRLQREELARYAAETGRLRRAVSARFMAALDYTPSPTTRELSGRGEQVCWLFWDLMSEPTLLRTSDDYVSRLVSRLELLHECYEQAMRDLGLPRTVPAGVDPVDRSTEGALSSS
jgi:hypothetical protein